MDGLVIEQRVSVLLEADSGPRPPVAEQSVRQNDKLAHDGDEGPHFAGFPAATIGRTLP